MDVLVGLGLDRDLEFVGLDHRDRRPRAAEQSRPRLDRLGHHDLCLGWPGDPRHELEPQGRRLGAVDRDEDAHGRR